MFTLYFRFVCMCVCMCMCTLGVKPEGVGPFVFSAEEKKWIEVLVCMYVCMHPLTHSLTYLLTHSLITYLLTRSLTQVDLKTPSTVDKAVVIESVDPPKPKPLPKLSSTSSHTLKEFSIVTYNVWFDAFQFQTRAKHLFNLLKQSNAHVICLQEVRLVWGWCK